MSDGGRKLWDWGVRELVCVTRPQGTIAPSSNLSPAALGKAPGRLNAAGQWTGWTGWESHRPTEEEVEAWDEAGANIGVLARFWPALDLDVESQEAAVLVCRALSFHYQNKPVLFRRSRDPRGLFAFRAAEPGTIKRRRLRFELGGQEHMVELLGDGQQWVAEGLHPSGNPYETLRLQEDAWDVRGPSELTPEICDDLFETIRGFIEDAGGQILKVTGSRGERREKDQDELRAEDPEQIQELVDHIPNTSDFFPDRSDYLTVGYAIKAAGGSFETWWSWCERWEDGANDLEEARADWARMKPPYSVGIDWLKDHAQMFGGYNPLEEEFEEYLREAPEEDDEGREPLLDYRYTDQMLAAGFLNEFGSGVRHATGMGWFAWDGVLWTPRADKLVHSRVANYLRRRAQEPLRDPALPRTRAEGLASRIGSATTLQKVMGLVENSLECAIEADDFNPDPYKLNTPDGIVDLTAGALLPHDRDELCSQITPTSPTWEPATCWLRFLYEVTHADEEFIHYLQKLAGYALTGSIKEHALFFIYGPGGNGKSVFVNALSQAVGTYAAVAPMETFAHSRQARHPTDIAGLKGARLVTAQETQEGMAWNEGLVKSLTGGEPIAARFMRQDFFTFSPEFKIILSGNHQPEIHNLDPAWRRRMHLIPFTYVPPEADLDLPAKLEGEQDRILAWAVEGVRLWLDEGLERPQAVLEATEEYFETQNPEGQFLEEELADDPHGFISTQELYKRWETWAVNHRYPVGSYQAFCNRAAAELSRRPGVRKGRHPEKGNRTRGYMGLSFAREPGTVNLT